MKKEAINIKNKYENFTSQWQPHVIAQMNDNHFKIARIEGEFIWHSHEDSDEVFIIIEGEMQLHFRDEIVSLKEGDMYVVPKGVEHKPVAQKECKILMIESSTVVNTGDIDCDKTVKEVKHI